MVLPVNVVPSPRLEGGILPSQVRSLTGKVSIREPVGQPEQPTIFIFADPWKKNITPSVCFHVHGVPPPAPLGPAVSVPDVEA